MLRRARSRANSAFSRTSSSSCCSRLISDACSKMARVIRSVSPGRGFAEVFMGLSLGPRKKVRAAKM